MFPFTGHKVRESQQQQTIQEYVESKRNTCAMKQYKKDKGQFHNHQDCRSLPGKILPVISATCVVSCLCLLVVLKYGSINQDQDATTHSNNNVADLTPFYYSEAQNTRFLQATTTTATTTKTKTTLDLDSTVQLLSPVNDDVTRDETCKTYMSKFLNGTTDFQDECQGMLNAYEAADCEKDTETIIFAVHERREMKTTKKHHHHHHKPDSTNSTDDDVLMDDFYEEWQCCKSIYQYYSIHCREPELNSGRLLGIVGVLVVCSIVKSLIHQGMGLDWLPDTAIYVLVGALVGIICRFIAPAVVAEKLTFDNDLFLHILLPPIIFQSALTIDKRSFRRDLFPILSFAVFGTVISAVAVGMVTYYLSGLGKGTHLPLLDSLLFGALISSIDPVATLGTLASVGVSQRDTLFTLIFGESLLNDGVAIVLFDTLVKHLKAGSAVDRKMMSEIMLRFIGITFGSILVGVVCGSCCAIYFYNLYGRHSAVTEVAIFFSWALIPFYLSDFFNLSGIIAIMTMAFFLDFYVVGGNQSEEGQWIDFIQLRCLDGQRIHSEGDLFREAPEVPSEPTYCERLRLAWSRTFSGRGHILSKSRHQVDFVARVISDIMETAIFTYLGLFLFNDKNQWKWKLNGVAIFGCIFSRLGMVIVISGLINLCVCCDVEGMLLRCLRRVWSDLTTPADNTGIHHTASEGAFPRSARTTLNDPLLGGHLDDPPTGEEDDPDDDSRASTAKRFLDAKTQMLLLLAGIRGAVSFALVANVPVYNAVTKQGSQYKAELKAMTSSSIIFTLFVFGAITYFIVKAEPGAYRERIAGNLTHRLSSMPLGSDNGDEDEEGDSDALASTLEQMEIESSPLRTTTTVSFER